MDQSGMFRGQSYKREGLCCCGTTGSGRGEVEIGAYTLTCKFEAIPQNFNCHITGVYAPNNYVERRLV